jgi:hypothetical protein
MRCSAPGGIASVQYQIPVILSGYPESGQQVPVYRNNPVVKKSKRLLFISPIHSSFIHQFIKICDIVIKSSS